MCALVLQKWKMIRIKDPIQLFSLSLFSLIYLLVIQGEYLLQDNKIIFVSSEIIFNIKMTM